jgi:hypothetical protein
MFAEDLAGRVLPFEARAAARYPEIVLARRQAGNPRAAGRNTKDGSSLYPIRSHETKRDLLKRYTGRYQLVRLGRVRGPVPDKTDY